jgi:hypothetical protein
MSAKRISAMSEMKWSRRRTWTRLASLRSSLGSRVGMRRVMDQRRRLNGFKVRKVLTINFETFLKIFNFH